MPDLEKRSTPRLQSDVSVRFRCFGLTDTEEISTCAVNISRSGMFITSPVRLMIGTSLSMRLRVPTELSGSVFHELCCIGRVVHEQKLSTGATGYGIKIEKTTPGVHPAFGLRAAGARLDRQVS